MKKKNRSADLVTRSILREELDKLNLRFEKMEEVFKDYRDEVLNKFDYFVKDLETNREDRDLAVHQTRELEEKVGNHEKRIKKLEAHL